jgi:WD40 repeat protein
MRTLCLGLTMITFAAAGCGVPAKPTARSPKVDASCALEATRGAHEEGRLLRATRLLRELSRRCPRSAERAALRKQVSTALAAPQARGTVDAEAKLRSRRLHAAAHADLLAGHAKLAVEKLSQALTAWPGSRLLIDLAQARRVAGDPRGARIAASRALALVGAKSLARPVLRLGQQPAKPLRLVALHPSGGWVAGSDGAAVTVWEAATGRWLATLGHSDKGIVALSFRADGALVTGDGEGHVRFWDIHRGDRSAEELVLGDPVVALSCARAAPLVAITTASGKLVLYDGKARRVRWKKSVGHRAVVFAANDKTVISGGDVDCRQQGCDAAFRRRAIERDHPDWVAARKARRRWRRGRLSLWGSGDGKALRWLTSPARRGASVALASSPRGELLAVSAAARVHLFELAGRRKRARKSWIVGEAAGLAFAGPAGRRLVVDNAIYDVERGQRVRTLLAKARLAIKDLAVVGDRAVFAVSERRGLLRTRGAVLVQLSAAAKGNPPPLRWLGSRALIEGSPRLVFGPKGERLLAVRGRRLWLWRPNLRATPRTALASGPVATVAWAPDGKTIAVGHGKRLELRSAETLKPTQGQDFAAVVEALAYRPDGQELAVGVGDDVLLLDASLHKRGRYGLHDRAVRGLSYDQAGNRLLSFSRSKHARLWRLPTKAGAQPRRLQQASSSGGPLWTAALHPDGARFVASRWIDLQLWGDQAGTPGRPVKVGGGVILATAFSRLGVLASGDDRGQVRLWELEAGGAGAPKTALKPLRVMASAHADRITDLAFSPKGQTLAVSDAAGLTALYGLDGRRLARLVADERGAWFVERGVLVDSSKRGDELVRWKVGAHVVPGWFHQVW